MKMLHLVIIALFILLIVSTIVWFVIYRRLDPTNPSSSRYYRAHQMLVTLIAVLAILVAVIIVLSSDPGDPDNYLYWP